MIKIFFKKLLLFIVLIQCGCKDYPKDTAGTLSYIKNNHYIRIGIVKHAPWVESLEPPRGSEVTIVEEYAKYLDVKIQWYADGEHVLVDQLEKGKIDLMIGGFTDQTPWKSKIALTRPYMITNGVKHVLVLRSGENAFLINVEEFLGKYRHATYN